MEAFDKDIKDVICTSTGITFTFSEQSAYDAAKTAWSWLSASDSRTVVAVLNQYANFEKQTQTYRSVGVCVLRLRIPREWVSQLSYIAPLPLC